MKTKTRRRLAACVFLIMREFHNIQGAVDAIKSAFSLEFARMDFLFTYRKGSHRNVVNVIRSLPDILLRVSDENGPDITFESTWVSDKDQRASKRAPQGGWQNVSATSWRVAYSYFAHSFMTVRNAREIAIFDYGFEILAADNFEILGVKSLAWKDPSVGFLQSISGKQFRGVPLAEGISDEIKVSWRHPLLVERARKLAERKSEFINVGQVSRELLLDDEI